MNNVSKTMKIAAKVLRPIMEEKFEREWVGLTDVEVAVYEIRLSGSGLAREIEAKLRERNT